MKRHVSYLSILEYWYILVCLILMIYYVVDDGDYDVTGKEGCYKALLWPLSQISSMEGLVLTEVLGDPSFR